VTLRDALTAELTTAMQRRDRPVIAALRTTLAALANAEAVPARDPEAPSDPPPPGASAHVAGATAGLGTTEAARQTLTPEAERALVEQERVELLSHADRLTRVCRRDEADGARRAADTLARALEQSAP
jgi:hypothetical protein